MWEGLQLELTKGNAQTRCRARLKLGSGVEIELRAITIPGGIDVTLASPQRQGPAAAHFVLAKIGYAKRYWESL